MVFVFINYQQNQNSLPHSLHPNVSTAASPSRDWVPPLQSQSNWLSPWKVAMKGLNPISEARDAFSKCEGFLQSRGALAYMAPRDYHPFQPQGWALRFSCTGKRLKVSEKPCFSTTSKNQSHGHKTSPGLSAVLDPRYHSENENKTKQKNPVLLSFQGTAMSISFPTILNFRNRTAAMNLSYWVSLLRNIQYCSPQASNQPNPTQCLQATTAKLLVPWCQKNFIGKILHSIPEDNTKNYVSCLHRIGN